MTDTPLKTNEKSVIYLLLPFEDTDNYNKEIVSFLSKKINRNRTVKIIKCNKHIIEQTLSHINSDDYVLWNPKLASDNLYLVNQFRNSVVILKHQTFYIQKNNIKNPITENMAINNNFKIAYIDETETNVNSNYSLILDKSYYLFDINKLNNNNDEINKKE